MFIAIQVCMKKTGSAKEHTVDIKANSKRIMTFFVIFVLNLVSVVFASHALAAKAFDSIKPSKKVQITDYKLSSNKKDKKIVSGGIEVSRSTSLYNFQDGTKSDDISLSLAATLTTDIGKFSFLESYAKDLNNEESTRDGFSDLAISYSNGAIDWDWSPPYVLTMTPSVKVILPISEVSVKRDQLQTAVSGGLSFGIRPDSLGAQQDGAWNTTVSVTAGRSFHTYKENIHGDILNLYSSNQGLTLGYTISDFGFTFNYTNMSRWTYDGNIKQFYVMSQEISYSINEQFNMAIGHTNALVSVLKQNGFESNVQVIDENNSAVYLNLGATF
jgi:hypothetical protein